MSRFSSLFDALSDKKARFLAEKQIVNDLIFDFYFNRLEGKNNFDAVVNSGGPDGNPGQRVDAGEGDLIAIKVRPLDIQDLALPDPCSETCKGKGESYISYLYALHPTAYSTPNTDDQITTPGFGSIVECYFEDRKNFRQLRWRPKGPDAQGNYDFPCGEAGSMIGGFDRPQLLGNILTEETYVGLDSEPARDPLNTIRVTSRMGERDLDNDGILEGHWGVDYGAPVGTPIYASFDGTVQQVKLDGSVRGFDNWLVTRHEVKNQNGEQKTIYLVYGHISDSRLKTGESFDKGDVIADVGNEGAGTGPHLHLELYTEWYKRDSRVDPITALGWKH